MTHPLPTMPVQAAATKVLTVRNEADGRLFALRSRLVIPVEVEVLDPNSHALLGWVGTVDFANWRGTPAKRVTGPSGEPEPDHENGKEFSVVFAAVEYVMEHAGEQNGTKPKLVEPS